MSEYAIEVRELTKKYGSTLAVDQISFQVEKGEIFGLLGPNGAGKTTTIRVLTTLIPPTSGDVKVLGFNVVTEGHKIRSRIGVVQQQPSYEWHMAVKQSLELYGVLWGVPRRERQHRIELLLEKFGLKDAQHTKTSALSLGQLKRLQVAREFMHDAELLFLDEPTTALDPQARRVTLDFIRERAQQGVTIFFTTHILQEAEQLCDRVAIIDQGRILCVDTTQGIKSRFGGLHLLELEIEGEAKNLLQGLAAITGIEEILEVPGKRNLLHVLTRNPVQILPGLMDFLRLQSGQQLKGLRLKEPTLEDVFIQLIVKESVR